MRNYDNIKFNYYYNDVPGDALCRNNLIYTSLISEDKKLFCQWYHNDTDYHKGMNEVVDPALMEEKWEREVKFLTLMQDRFPQHVPPIDFIDYDSRKIYLNIDGVDFWERAFAFCPKGVIPTDKEFFPAYDKVLSDWKEQMLEIIQAHNELGIYKMSMHPSSYFIINGKLKSINYFFSYFNDEPGFSIQSVLSHISEMRRADLFPKMAKMGIIIDNNTPIKDLQMLIFESFKTNFPEDFIEKAKSIYA